MSSDKLSLPKEAPNLTEQKTVEGLPNLDELDRVEIKRERSLEEPLRETFFGSRFASLNNFFSSWYDKLLWSWYGADVARAQQQEKEREIRRNRPKLRKEFKDDNL